MDALLIITGVGTEPYRLAESDFLRLLVLAFMVGWRPRKISGPPDSNSAAKLISAYLPDSSVDSVDAQNLHVVLNDITPPPDLIFACRKLRDASAEGGFEVRAM